MVMLRSRSLRVYLVELFIDVYNGSVMMRTLDWIWQNKQWLFSGVGVSVIALLFWVFNRVARRVPPSVISGVPSMAPPLHLTPRAPSIAAPPPALEGPVSDAPLNRFTKPTPHEINEQIRAVPPFQQRDAKRAYEGLKVCWLTEFSGVQQDAYELGRRDSARKRGKKTTEVPWLVTLFHRQEKKYSGEIVTCYGVSLATYPQLKFAHANTPVVVSGTIRSVFNIGVELIDVDA
jgi:hypothetical protein